MRSNGRRGRLLSAALSTLILASAIPAITSPAIAAPVYTLTGPAQLRAGQTGTFVLTATEAMPSGDYCVSVDAASGLTSTSSSQAAGASTTELTFSVTVAGATPDVAVFTAYQVGSPGACPTTTPGGATPLEDLVLYVAGPPVTVHLAPGTSTVPTSTPATILWSVRDANGLPTYLLGAETIDVTSTTSTTVTFNGAVLPTLILTSASPTTFTAQNSVAQSANVTAALNVGITPTPKDTVTLTTSGSATTGLSVTPTTTTTSPGGTTTFTITATGVGGILLPDVPVYAAVAGRNPRAETLVGTTNVAGSVTWALTDTNTSSSVLQDTVTFTGNGVTRVSTVTYSGTSTGLAVTPANTNTSPGGTTTFTVTATGAGGILLPGIPIYASVAGRNPRASTLIGTTSVSGTLVWPLVDANPTSSVLQDTVTFTGNGATKTAVVTYTSNTMNVFPSQAITAVGGSTLFTITVFSAQGVPAPAVPVSVSSTGRNTFTARSVGLTNANGQATWVQQDGASSSGSALVDQLTFSTSLGTVQATVTYPTATITSPVNGSRLSTGGLFGVSALTTGVPAGTLAYLTLNGNATAVSAVQPNGAVRFDGTAVGGGRWIPAQDGDYAVRLCGGACGDALGISSSFRLSLIPFGIISNGQRAEGRLTFSVAVGNFSSGTPIELTRNGITVATGRVRQVGSAIVIVAPYRPGNYQVRVSTPQGVAFGDHSGVVWVP